MDILRGFFVSGLIFRAEMEINSTPEQEISRAIHLIRVCFSGTIN
jgi:hypothetical protein